MWNEGKDSGIFFFIYTCLFDPYREIVGEQLHIGDGTTVGQCFVQRTQSNHQAVCKTNASPSDPQLPFCTPSLLAKDFEFIDLSQSCCLSVFECSQLSVWESVGMDVNI